MKDKDDELATLEKLTKINKQKKEKKAESSEEKISHDIPDTANETEKLRRIEIICSQAMGEDLLDGFKFRKIKCYTQIPSLVGTGYSVPKLGNEIWPQLNTMFIVYCNKEDSKKIKALIKTLRKQFVGEGLACYVSKAKEWQHFIFISGKNQIFWGKYRLTTFCQPALTLKLSVERYKLQKVDYFLSDNYR